MSGFGERFRRAGYDLPKPLIEIDGKPIIAHVIDMFPGETDFVFICNKEHLAVDAYRMRETLAKFCPTGKVVAIDSHKLGPIHAVLMAKDYIDFDRPTIVNYCDFSCYWNWQGFKEFVAANNCRGAVPAYRGFHPHTLGTTNYAYLKEESGWMTAIQEKKPYTDDRMNEFASSGTYYFDSARLMLQAFEAAEENDWSVNGEFYVSLAYLFLLQMGMGVAVYPLQHFMQWGTPEDVREYREWSRIFDRLASPIQQESDRKSGSLVVPMAGFGQRFIDEGYALPKPLIEVSGRPMVLQAVSMLPKTSKQIFVLRNEMPGAEEIAARLEQDFPDGIVERIDGPTEGQACTAMLGVQRLEREVSDASAPITFGACDFGALYDQSEFQEILDTGADVIVWVVRGNPNAIRKSQMFGWVEEVDGAVRSISVKKALSDPAHDPIVLGTFTFKNAGVFHRCYDRLVERNGKVNGEFYLDSCVNDALALGMECRILEVDHYISWGTPNDLRTFEYWQSCFSKWKSHRYALGADAMVPHETVHELSEKYATFAEIS
jgi:NDP-sugar pyrophosphorylase family protein